VKAAPTYFLKTARLGFRRWSPEDLPLAVALWADQEVTRLIGGPFSEEQIHHRLDQEIAFLRAEGVQYWPVFLLAGDDFAGCCGLRPYGREAKIRELGFHFRPTQWGKGLASEAAGAVIQYAEESLGLEGLFAGHHPENLASRRVLQKLRFRFTHEELYPPTGKMHSCYFLKLSK
jgi:ribosomal-protein-alanine N-acetyltransferase